jgi:hypothetical protein
MLGELLEVYFHFSADHKQIWRSHAWQLYGIRQVAGSNTGSDMDYFHLGVAWFSSFPLDKLWDYTSTTPIPYRFFPVHYSLPFYQSSYWQPHEMTFIVTAMKAGDSTYYLSATKNFWFLGFVWLDTSLNTRSINERSCVISHEVSLLLRDYS